MVGKVVDTGSGVSADLRGRKVMAIMIKGAYAQFAVAGPDDHDCHSDR